MIKAGKVDIPETKVLHGFSAVLGMRFRLPLKRDQALIFLLKEEGRESALVDMMFVFFPLTVVWLDARKRVVDVKKAFPFGFYLPERKAKYVVETHADNFHIFRKGMNIEF